MIAAWHGWLQLNLEAEGYECRSARRRRGAGRPAGRHSRPDPAGPAPADGDERLGRAGVPAAEDRLRRVPGGRPVGICARSGPQPGSRRLGANQYLVKPFGIADLLDLRSRMGRQGR